METLKELYEEKLKDIFNAENQISDALPKIIEKTSSEDLKSALQEHLEETKDQIDRLQQVFEKSELKEGNAHCKAMKGILEEGEDDMKKSKSGMIRDMSIVSGSKKVEHYEMSSYHDAIHMAEKLGLDEAVGLLQENLKEEEHAHDFLHEFTMKMATTA